MLRIKYEFTKRDWFLVELHSNFRRKNVQSKCNFVGIVKITKKIWKWKWVSKDVHNRYEVKIGYLHPS